MRRLGLAVAVVLVGSLGLAEGASACSCVGPGQVYKSTDAAFTGRLIEKKRSDGSEIYTYRVLRVYKEAGRFGPYEGNKVSLQVSLIRECGTPQRLRKRYGVMARLEENDSMSANGCTMTSAERLRKIAANNGDTRSAASASSGCGA